MCHEIQPRSPGQALPYYDPYFRVSTVFIPVFNVPERVEESLARKEPAKAAARAVKGPQKRRAASGGLRGSLSGRSSPATRRVDGASHLIAKPPLQQPDFPTGGWSLMYYSCKSSRDRSRFLCLRHKMALAAGAEGFVDLYLGAAVTRDSEPKSAHSDSKQERREVSSSPD